MTRRRLGILSASLVVIAAGGATVATGALASGDDERILARAIAAEIPVLQKSRLRSPVGYRLARSQGAEIRETADGKTFYVYKRGTLNPRAVVVTLHGAKSTAFDQYEFWAGQTLPRGYGLLSIQWRVGFDGTSFKYSPAWILGTAARVLAREGVPPGRALIQGYSYGAFYTYGVMALDQRGRRRFSLAIANAGTAVRDFPLKREINTGRYGPRPFRGTEWILYCGRNDHTTTGCPQTFATRSYLRRKGAGTVQVIAGANRGHSGFFRTAGPMKLALDTFAAKLGG